MSLTLTHLPRNPKTGNEVRELLGALSQRARAMKRDQTARYVDLWDTRVRMALGVEAAIGLASMLVHVVQEADSGRLLAESDRAGEYTAVSFTGLTGLAEGTDDPFVRDMYENAVRVNLLVTVQFRIDAMMSDLLRALGLQPSRVFEVNAATLLRTAKVSAPARKAKWMYVPSLMRNTLHNGGLHGTKTRRVTIGDVTYSFEKNRRFEQAAWNHIAHVLSAELDILGELLAAALWERVGRIPDRFAFIGDVGYPPRKPRYPLR